MSVMEYIKEHPWTVAGIVGGVVVLYLLYSSGSSAPAATAATNAANADPALQIAQLQLTGQNQALQEKLAETQTTTAASVAIAQLQAQLGIFGASASRDVSLAGIQAQEDIQLSGQQSQVQLAQIEQATNQMQIAATRDIAIGNAATYAHIADVNAATVIANTQANVDIAQITSNERVTINSAQQKTAQKSSSNSLISGIVGAAASVLPFLFSDGDLKIDIQTIGYDAKGRRWIQFRYAGDRTMKLRTGVVAQEILASDPGAVARHSSGYLMVDYARLN